MARSANVVHFAPELDAMDPTRAEVVAEAVTATLSMENLETLRFLRELARDEAAAVMTVTLMALMDDR